MASLRLREEHPVQIRRLEGAQDAQSLRDGFRQVFGSDISPAMLDWKYGQGRGCSWGAFSDDGRLVAHCGVMYREALADGQRVRVAQLVDLLATSSRSDGLSRQQSAFFRLIDSVLGSVRDARNPDALCFGFPSDRAMRLGERLGVFAAIDRIHEVTLPRLPPVRMAWWRPEVLGPGQVAREAFASDVNRLWSRMAQGLGAGLVGVHDAGYFQHRYVAHPEHAYVLCRVRSWLGASVACAALRRHGEVLELMDLVVDMRDLVPAIQALRRHLPALGGEALKLWLNEGQLKRLPAEMGLESVALQFRIMANPRSSGGDAQRFAGRWWLTSGDTDYR